MGHSDYGGDSSNVKDQLINIKEIYSTFNAFAAVLNNGTVITWGNPKYGGNSSTVTLTNITKIYSTYGAFAAVDTAGNIYVADTYNNQVKKTRNN
jgi:hypothetical protein